MKYLLLVALLGLLTTLPGRAQSHKSQATLSYQTPTNVNGLRNTQLTLDWEVQSVSIFGDLVLTFDASAAPDYTAYNYQNQVYHSTGEDNSLFRQVRMTLFKVRVRVEGPGGYSEVLLLDGTAGMGKGAFFGNSHPLPTAKNKEQAKPANWRVTPLQVVSVSWDGGSDLRNHLDRQNAERKKQAAYDKAREAGMAAANRGDWAGAIREYEKAKSVNGGTPELEEQLARAQENLRKKGVQDRYDDLVKTAREAERQGDKKGAEGLYKQAAATGHPDPEAARAGDRLAREQAADAQRQQNEQAARQAETEAKAKAQADARTRDDQQAKQKLDELRQNQEKALAARHDSLKAALGAAESRRLDEARDKQRREQAEAAEAERTRRAEKLQAHAADRRHDDDEALRDVEDDMAYDPEQYARAVAEADSAFAAADEVDPFGALELKREWWDNNAYIQVIADDLYEEQRQNNHQEYTRRLYAESSAYELAKGYYLAAVPFVNPDSRQHKYLLAQLERCNKRLDHSEENQGDAWEMEQARRRNREFMRSMAAARQFAANRNQADAAFYVYDRQATIENQGQVLMQKFDFEQRLNQADEQYKRDAALTGVTVAVATDAYYDNTKVAKAATNGAPMFNCYLGGVVAFEDVPLLMNHTSSTRTPETKTGYVSTVPVVAGLDVWFWRSHGFDVGISGDIGYGVNPRRGYTSSMFSWSVRGRLDLGRRKLKWANTVEALGRSGQQDLDYDIIISDDNPYYTPENHLATGSFDYSVFRVGTGLKFDFSDDTDQFLLVQAFAEKPSFYDKPLTQPIFSYRLELQIGPGLNLRVGYANNYAIAGKRAATLTDQTNQGYLSVMLGKSWTLFGIDD